LHNWQKYRQGFCPKLFNGGLKTSAMDDMALQAIFTSSDYCLYTLPKNHEVVNLLSVGFQTNEK